MTATTETAAPAAAPQRRAWWRGNLDLLVNPAVVVVGLGLVALYASTVDFDSVARRALNPAGLRRQTIEHLVLTGVSTLIVIVIAVPLGVALSRDAVGRSRGAVLAVGGFLQALPPLGVVVLIGFWLGFEPSSMILALVLASLLPVLTNTVVGLRQVDDAMIEAARGMGMTAWRTLLGVELPLAIPVMMAGIRVALVLNVGTATFGAFIGAGGLGVPLFSMLKLFRLDAVLVIASLVAALALLVDWFGAIVERLVAGRAS
ncbi:MAG: ABC transporter permease [Pseudonocardia sp.]|nr:ABC transporter permease [Pseudonocardia sp.]